MPKKYVVERIIAMKQTAKGPRFLVAWEGYPGEDSWEPRSNLVSCPEMLKEFLKSQEVNANGKPLSASPGRDDRSPSASTTSSSSLFAPFRNKEQLIGSPQSANKSTKRKRGALSSNRSDRSSSINTRSSTSSARRSKKQSIASPRITKKKAATPPKGSSRLNGPSKEDYTSGSAKMPKQFVVERIIARKQTAKGPQYLVAWEGYPGEDTWEPESNLNCPEMLDAFLKSQEMNSNGTPTKRKRGERRSMSPSVSTTSSSSLPPRRSAKKSPIRKRRAELLESDDDEPSVNVASSSSPAPRRSEKKSVTSPRTARKRAATPPKRTSRFSASLNGDGASADEKPPTSASRKATKRPSSPGQAASSPKRTAPPSVKKASPKKYIVDKANFNKINKELGIKSRYVDVDTNSKEVERLFGHRVKEIMAFDRKERIFNVSIEPKSTAGAKSPLEGKSSCQVTDDVLIASCPKVISNFICDITST